MKISTKVECGIIAIADIAMNSENGETVTVFATVFPSKSAEFGKIKYLDWKSVV